MKKTLLTILKVVLHVVGFPLLLALVFILNLDVIKGGSMYGVAVFVCAIITVVMAVVYYLAYFLVRTKKSRSIRNQHIIVAIVAVCCLSGFWMLLDGFIPGPLENATSSTVRWEDLSDNWGARAEVQEKLLRDYVTINYNLGRLTAPNGETIEDYISQGPNGNAELHDLLSHDYHSIDSDGYSSYMGPSIDYAQSDRMTIPVLLHLFLDDRSDVQGANSAYAKKNNLPEVTLAVPYYDVYDYESGDKIETDVRIYHGAANGSARFFVTDQDLNIKDDYTSRKIAVISQFGGGWALVVKSAANQNEYEAVQCATFSEALSKAADEISGIEFYFVGGYKQASVNWHVLDMLGTSMEMNILSESLVNTDLLAMLNESGMGIISSALPAGVQYISDILELDLVPDAFALVADMVAEDEVLGSPIYISLDSKTGTLTLEPSNSHRGVLGYMEMAWLDSQGLLYIIVSLFSVRTLFYIYGPIMGLIAVLLGFVREKEQALQGADGTATNAPQKAKKSKKSQKSDEQEQPQADDKAVDADDLIAEDDAPQQSAGSDIVDFDF